MKLKDIRNPLEELIITDISDEELDERLRYSVLRKKVVGGEQWFRNYSYWYSTPAYANPYKTPFEELHLIMKVEKKLQPYIVRTLKVYYGLGIGDTEIIPVIWDLSLEKYAEICTVDVVRDFIENFIQGLRNLIYYPQFLTSKIKFLAYNTLFEKLKPGNLQLLNSKYNRFTHICFGNTIGNFDQHEIFSIFKQLIKPDDYLLLGYQLNIGKDLIIKQYEGNFRFNRLIEACIRKLEHLRNKRIEWKYNEETDYIEAWINNVLVFRSKKYNPTRLENFARDYGFEIVRRKLKPLHFKYGLVGISLFKRV